MQIGAHEIENWAPMQVRKKLKYKNSTLKLKASEERMC